MLKIARFIFVAASLLASSLVALAQPAPGPVPPPSPWLYAAPQIYAPAGSCITIPQTVSGGCVAPNSFNISGNYYKNGLAFDFITTVSPPLVFSAGTLSLGFNSSLVLDGSNNLGINLTNTNTFSQWQIVDRGTGSEPGGGTGLGWLAFGVDGGPTRDEITAFNNGVSGATAIFDGRTSLGTRASPLTVTSGTLLASFEGKGYDSSVWTGTGGSLHVYAEGTWTTISHPGEACVAATAIGATTTTDQLCVHNDGGVTVGSVGSEGSGTLNLNGALYNSGTAPTGTGAYVRATSPTLVTPTIGAATGTSLALGGCTIGSQALCETGAASLNGVVTVLSGGNIGFGTSTNPQNAFVFSLNAATGLNPAGTQSGVWGVGADGLTFGYQTFTFGNTPQNQFFRADGTAASPTAVVSTDILGNVNFIGYSGSGTTYLSGSRIVAVATETFSTNRGTYLELDATPTGSATRAQAMRLQAGVIVGTGTSDPGPGNLLVGGTITINGTPLGLTSGGTAASLTASNGGIVYSTASAFAVLAGTVTANQCLLSGASAAPTWGACAGGAAVSSVTNSDGTLTISPTTGAVVASLALGHANTWTNTVTVNPTANSYTQAINITQSSPTSGSQVGPLSYNLIAVTDESDITGSAGTTQTSGLRLNMNVGGANLAGQPKIGFYVDMRQNISGVTASADKVAIVASALNQIVEPGGGGGLYAFNGSASVQSSGFSPRVVGIEVDVGGTSGSTMTNRYGYNATNLGVIQGSTLDAAYLVTNFTGSGGAWKAAFELSNTLGFAPLSTSGDVMTADAAMTVSSVIDFPSMTVTNWIFRFPNANLTGGGALTLGGMTNVATTSAVCYNTGTGLLTYDGTVGTCTVSDETLKNIGPRIDNALERLLKITGFYFTFKDQAAYGRGEQIGVGAQTVERVFPELVSTDSNGIKSLAYDKLTAPIIEALRELKADNDNLQREIVELKRQRSRSYH